MDSARRHWSAHGLARVGDQLRRARLQHLPLAPLHPRQESGVLCVLDARQQVHSGQAAALLAAARAVGVL